MRRVKRLVAVVQELSLARSFDAVRVVVRTAARELTGADGATFVLRDNGRCFYLDEDAIAPLWKGQRFPMSSCVSGWAMLNRQVAVIEDIYADPRIPADLYRPTFVKSMAMVPIRTREPLGAIGVYWATRRMPQPDEIDLLRALADSTSTAIENLQLLSDLESQIQDHLASLEAARRAEAAARAELLERRRTQQALEKTELELRQAQKMEVIGQLAGGIAHDFNNVLSVILTTCGMMIEDAPPGAAYREDVEDIRRAGERAANLTRQLLAVSRRQVFEPRVLDLRHVVTGIEKMLRRLIGENVGLTIRAHAEPVSVLADQGQIEQVVMNLALNARDAMPRGGTLTIATSVERGGAPAVKPAADDVGTEVSRADTLALLSVADNGTGMDQETLARIFEPFFTTKGVGKGTGLGLSTAYGIVRQSGGIIDVRSAPGAGATFRVWLPIHTGPDPRGTVRPVEAPRSLANETVLLVEDDDAVRAAARAILLRHGYQVLEAAGGAAALETAAAYPGRIDLLLTDVVMPEMNGVELADTFCRSRPDTRVLCMSGYSEEAIETFDVIDSPYVFMQKPITAASLIRRVRDVLDR